MNIIWQQPDYSISVTSIFDDSDPAEHATKLKAIGNVPRDWQAVAFNYEAAFPDTPQETWRWTNGSIVATAPLAVPDVVTMRQARLALLQNGMLTQVNTAVANMSGAAGDAARIEWEFSSTVERNRPLVQSLIGVLGLTESQLDDLFRQAATL